jgi:hypothetical protein
MYFILTDGAQYIHMGLGRYTDEDLRDESERQYAALADDRSEMSEYIPDELREDSRPILLSLLCPDPTRRSSVAELAHNKWLMEGDATR